MNREPTELSRSRLRLVFSAVTDSTGRFYITGVTPGGTVIVVGDLEGQYEVVSEPDDPDKALVVALLPGKILEVNELIVDLVQLSEPDAIKETSL